MNSYGAIIVSWDFSHGKDLGVLIIGKQENGHIEIVNAFQGEEAKDLYNRLITRKEKIHDPS